MMIVHVQPDGSVRLEGVAPNRPTPKLPANSFLIDSKDVPGKQETLVWDSDTGKLKVDPQKKAAHDAKDRRPPMERLVDSLITTGALPPDSKDRILD